MHLFKHTDSLVHPPTVSSVALIFTLLFKHDIVGLLLWALIYSYCDLTHNPANDRQRGDSDSVSLPLTHPTFNNSYSSSAKRCVRHNLLMTESREHPIICLPLLNHFHRIHFPRIHFPRAFNRKWWSSSAAGFHFPHAYMNTLSHDPSSLHKSDECKHLLMKNIKCGWNSEKKANKCTLI